MRQRILRGISVMAVALLLGAYLAHAQNQGGIQANFAPNFPPKKVDARSTPAKVTSVDDYALTSKGYVLIGWVTASQAGKKTDAAVTKQLESAILQKAAEAGGDVVRLVKEGALETTQVPTGKTKTKRDCLDSQQVSVSQFVSVPCYSDGTGLHCPAGHSETKYVTRCTKWGEPEIVAITRKEEGLVSIGAVWRYDSEQASVVMRARGDINTAVGAGDLNRVQALLKDHPELISSKDASGDTPLHAAIAAKAGKNLVDLLLASNADVNARGANGATPLHLAGVSGDQSLVQQLLDHKADINARQNTGETILLLTACQGNTQMAEFLLANKADINIRDAGGNTPLHCAAIGGHAEVVRVLLAHKADVNAGNRTGYTPLAFLKSVTKLKTKQFKEIAEMLRQAGGGMVPDTGGKEIAEASAMPNQSGSVQVQSKPEDEIQEAAAARDLNKLKSLLKDNPSLISSREPENGYTPLHTVVVRGGVTAVVEFLLASGADINAKDSSGLTPLFYAVSLGDEGVAELLLAHNADIDARDNLGGTALHSVAMTGTRRMVEFLLANKADVNAKDDFGRTPLHYAAEYGKAETVRELLAHNADVNHKDNNGVTPFAMAEAQRQKAIVALLRQNGGAQAQSSGHTEIYDAAANGDLKKIQALLKAHPELISSKDTETGYTPLHAAAENGRKDAAELLIANNAEVNARDTKGRTPFEYAVVQRHNDVAELLLAHQADINAADNQGKTTLHAAAFFGQKDVVEFLLAHKAEADIKDESGMTPLHSAASQGHKAVAEVLLAHNADVNAKTKEGATPLDYAKAKGHSDVAELLRQHGGR